MKIPAEIIAVAYGGDITSVRVPLGGVADVAGHAAVASEDHVSLEFGICKTDADGIVNDCLHACSLSLEVKVLILAVKILDIDDCRRVGDCFFIVLVELERSEFGCRSLKVKFAFVVKYVDVTSGLEVLDAVISVTFNLGRCGERYGCGNECCDELLHF